MRSTTAGVSIGYGAGIRYGARSTNVRPISGGRFASVVWAVLIAAVLVALPVAASPSGPAATPIAQLNPTAGPGPWLFTDTDHLRIIYRPDDRAAAAEVASFGDTTFERVADYVGYRPSKLVPVIIQNAPARANGFYAPIPDRVTLYVASPTYPLLGTGRVSWLKLVLTHELTHYLHLTEPTGLFGALSKVLGPAVLSANVAWMPGWFIEGIPTNAETDLTSGGRGRSPLFEMTYAAPAIEDAWFTYDQAAFDSHTPPAGRHYTAGYAFVNYLRDKYGPQTIRDTHDTYARAPFLGMRRAMRKTFDRPAPELFADFQDTLSRRYTDRTSVPAGTAIHPSSVGNWYLPILTDRGLFSFRSTPEHGRRLMFLVDGSSVISRSTDGDEGTPASPTHEEKTVTRNSGQTWTEVGPLYPIDPWSFDIRSSADRIVYARVSTDITAGNPAGEVSDLYVRPILWTGNTPRFGPEEQLTQGKRLFHPRFDPHSNRIVAVERRGSHSRLVAVDTAGGDVSVLYEQPGVTVQTPAVDRNTGTIASVHIREGKQELVVLGSDGATLARPATGGDQTDGAWYFPRFSADGRLTASWDGSGHLQVYEIARSWEQVGSDGRERQGGSTVAVGHQPSGDAPALVARDPVGAYEAVCASSHILYGTYRTRGYSVLETPAADAPPGGVGTTGPTVIAPDADAPDGAAPNMIASEADAPDTPAAAATPADAAGTARYKRDRATNSLRSRPYRPVPTPQLWLPTVLPGSLVAPGLQVDMGALLVLADPLGRHYAQVHAAYNPEAQHPSGTLVYQVNTGLWTTQLAAKHAYDFDIPFSLYRTTTGTALSVSAIRLIKKQYGPVHLSSVSASGAMEYRNRTQGAGLHSLAEQIEGTQDGTVEQGGSASATLGFQWERAERSAPAAMYGAGRSAIEIAGRYVYPLYYTDAEDQAPFPSLKTEPHIESVIGLTRQMPVFNRHGVFAATVDVGVSTDGTTREMLPVVDRFWTERSWTVRDGDIKVVGGFTARRPLGLFDGAWRGLGVLAAGVSGFVRQAAYLDLDGSAREEPFWVTGFTLETELQLWSLPLRLTSGVAFRMPHAPWQDAFIPEDFRVLLNVSPAGVSVGNRP